MNHKSSSRMDGHSLLTSLVYARKIRRLEEKVATLTRDKDELQQLIISKQKHTLQKDQRLDNLQLAIHVLAFQQAELKAQMLQAAKESKAREKKMLQAADESKERENKMLKAQKESKLLIESIQRYTKSGVYAIIGTTLIGDLVIDLYKEVIKRAIGQETWEAWGREIREWIEPWLNAILETVSSSFPMLLLIIKAAITIMVIAAPILNLTAVVWQPLRAGLGKFRSFLASKK